MKISHESLSKLELFSFLGLAVSLPIHESGKNILLALCLVLFLYRYFTLADTLKKSELGKYILIFLALSVIASLGALYNGYEVKKLHDILRFTLIGYIFVRTPISRQSIYLIFLALIGSTIIGSIQAYYLLYTGDKVDFELESVGQVNHSSIYLLLMTGLMLPFFLQNLSILKTKVNKVLFLLVTLAFVLVLFDTSSRATFIGFWIILILVVITEYFVYKKANLPLLSFAVMYLLFSLVSPPQVLGKFSVMPPVLNDSALSDPVLNDSALNSSALNDLASNNSVLDDPTPDDSVQYDVGISYRARIWYTSLYVLKKEPLFGIGFGNYDVITPEKMAGLYSDDIANKPDQNTVLYGFHHAHNRYFNTLTEGGGVGFLGLMIFILGAVSLLWRNAKEAFVSSSPSNVSFWLVGVNSLLTVTVVGLFNTTLHHEHGLLAMILIALSCGYFVKTTNQ